MPLLVAQLTKISISFCLTDHWDQLIFPELIQVIPRPQGFSLGLFHLFGAAGCFFTGQYPSRHPSSIKVLKQNNTSWNNKEQKISSLTNLHNKQVNTTILTALEFKKNMKQQLIITNNK